MLSSVPGCSLSLEGEMDRHVIYADSGTMANELAVCLDIWKDLLKNWWQKYLGGSYVDGPLWMGKKYEGICVSVESSPKGNLIIILIIKKTTIL